MFRLKVVVVSLSRVKNSVVFAVLPCFFLNITNPSSLSLLVLCALKKGSPAFLKSQLSTGSSCYRPYRSRGGGDIGVIGRRTGNETVSPATRSVLSQVKHLRSFSPLFRRRRRSFQPEPARGRSAGRWQVEMRLASSSWQAGRQPLCVAVTAMNAVEGGHAQVDRGWPLMSRWNPVACLVAAFPAIPAMNAEKWGLQNGAKNAVAPNTCSSRPSARRLFLSFFFLFLFGAAEFVGA